MTEGKINPLLFSVLCLACAVVLLMGFQMEQILRDKSSLASAYATQEKALEQFEQLQEKLDHLAVGTKKLAEGGNANAKMLIDQMQQIGITIKQPETQLPERPGSK